MNIAVSTVYIKLHYTAKTIATEKLIMHCYVPLLIYSAISPGSISSLAVES